ncbi:Alkaline phosphatase [Labilithrix luteola]|uniref:Alkaline phosphatase n=1 Tax=Labilithrix luteola TaxID=1391654 RepID=A0A0K1PXB0_9BACT|nr:calcium-binding protein [Labilithrix luteola]AKU98158.1 Alkaline phosphatase [Labilithrix luteola]
MRHTVSRTTTLFLAAILAACAGQTGSEKPDSPFNPDEPFAKVEAALTPLATACAFNATTGAMTVTIADGETAIISKRAADSAILQNGETCATVATSTTLKKITVTGSSGTNALILDFTNGLFALGTTSAASSGIAVDLGAGTDTLGIKGTSGADNFVFGAASILLNTDTNKDITVAGVEAYVVSLGDGDDVYSAAGNATAGAPFGAPIAVYGGAGNDTFNQGSVSTPQETISGGSGTDTVTYASRTAAVTVTIGAGSGASADDGVSGEQDDVTADVEVVVGGSGDDTLTASATAATLQGGPGNDTLIGGAGDDTLSGGAGNDILRGKAGNDILNGDDGDDVFDEETASNGADVFNGGNGIDTVDYGARTVALVVTMDGVAANDGEANEKDNVKADVENLKGGSGDDNITGNASHNKIWGGDGNDILAGGAGDDVFVQTGTTASDGDDRISGGTGVDTVDYSSRTVAVTATLDGATASGISGEADILATDVENLWGGSGDDTLTGNASANELVGNAGDDQLIALDGDDVLEGGAGDDFLNCGNGFDITLGSIGNDTKDPSCEL